MSAATLAREVAGWRVEHWFPARHAMTPLLAEFLLRRGPRPGVDETICCGPADSELAARFARAGWKVAVTDGSAPEVGEPQLRIFSPDRALAWRGKYRIDEVKSRDAVIFDDVVLQRLARGEVAPGHVPVGCVTPLQARPVDSRWGGIFSFAL